MRETLSNRPHHVASDPRPLRFYVDQVVARLRADTNSSLRRLIDALGDVPPREALIGSFCALLELVRLELVEVRQEEGEDDIAIDLRPEHADDIESVLRQISLEGEGTEEAEDGADGEEAPADAPQASDDEPAPAADAAPQADRSTAPGS